MTFDMAKVSQAVDVFIKAEIHAFVMLFVGAGLALAGHKDEGMLVIGGALAAFKGKANI